MSKDHSANINITVSKVGAAVVDLMTSTEGKIIRNGIMEDIADGIRKNNSAMGVESFIDVISVMFLGIERPSLHITTMVSTDRPMYQKQIMCFKDEYMFSVSVTSMKRDLTDDLIKKFHELSDYQ